ncbi:MAG: glycosyltransferase [Verrucomicrobiales bacterium]|nr:glycosyltransferase [Verrucomicrobiales bacterium]
MKTHLVIPCFREATRLPHFLPGLCAAMAKLGGLTVQVVDDGSGENETEATRKIVEDLRSSHPALSPLLALPHNLGKGGAVYAGWDSAPSDVEWLAFVDADGSISAREVIRVGETALSSPTSQAFFASRVKMLGRKVDRVFKRHLMGRIYATLVSELLRIPVYDSQCGLKIVPAAAYRQIRDRLTLSGFAFDVDLLVQLLRIGIQVQEVPIDWHEVPGGTIQLVRDSLRMARDVWTLRRTL